MPTGAKSLEIPPFPALPFSEKKHLCHIMSEIQGRVYGIFNQMEDFCVIVAVTPLLKVTGYR